MGQRKETGSNQRKIRVALNSINICEARAPNIEGKTLQQIYNSVESHIMKEVEFGDQEDDEMKYESP